MACPDSSELAHWAVDGVPERASAHVEACPACQRTLRRVRAAADTLSRRGTDDPSFVVEVVAALEQPRSRRPQRTVAMALGVAVALAVTVPLLLRDDFQPRGSPTTASQRAGVDFFAQLPGELPRRLSPDSRVEAHAGFSFIVHNRSGQPLSLMLFGVDARREVHWFYPAHRTAAEDPQSILIAGSATDQALAEAVAPEDAASGPFSLHAVFSHAPLRVSEVEAALAQGGLAQLQRDSRVTSVTGVKVERD